MSELKRLYLAFGYSVDGIKRAWQDEAAFRLEILLSIVIIPLSLYLGDTGIERALLLGSWLIVLMVELINSGLEAITNYATKNEWHDLAKKTKDVGSAAVLVAAVITAATWALVLL